LPPLHGLIFESAAEADFAQLGRQGPPAQLPEGPQETTPKSAGRPSYDAQLAAVIDGMAEELEDIKGTAARARLVRERMGADAPAQSTAETFLRTYLRPRRNSPEN